MTHQLYDLGYQSIKHLDLLVQVANALDGRVLDIRINPRSPNPQWNQGVMQRSLGERYVHLPALGNVTYKDRGAPIVIQDLEAGLQQIARQLEAHPAILLCACSNRESCHRLVVVKACQEQLGITSVVLDLERCQQIVREYTLHRRDFGLQ